MRDILTTDLQSVYSTYMDNFKEPITIDGVESTGFLQKGRKDHSETKYLFVDKGTLKQGALITVLNNNWLVVEDVITHFPVYDRGLIRRCNDNTSFNFAGSIITFPSIVVGNKFDITENQQANLLSGGITITLQDNEQSRKISIDQRIIFRQQAFKVSGKDNTNDGIIILTCRLTEIDTVYDDMENSIPDRWRYENTCEIEVINGNNIEIGLNQPTEIQIRVWATNAISGARQEVTNPILDYSSSDASILTINNAGVLNAIAEGTAQVTIILKSSNAEILAQAQVDVIVKDEPVIENTVTITGGSTIFFEAKQKYTVKLFVNGVETVDTFTFKIVNDVTGMAVSTSIAKLLNITATTCEVQAGETYTVIRLIAKSVSTGVEATKAITLRDIL